MCRLQEKAYVLKLQSVGRCTQSDLVNHSSKMGQLESGYFYLHTVCLIPPHPDSGRIYFSLHYSCSGIHRGMGTHISKVKSVELDAWTDEQLQNMIRWGNIKANTFVILDGVKA